MQAEQPELKPRSHIFGTGHGSAHCWQYSHTSAGRQSLYKCADCGETFWHDYDRIPDIFDAMNRCGIPAECPTQKEVSHS